MAYKTKRERFLIYHRIHLKFMGTYLIIILILSVCSIFVQLRFRSKFSKYTEIQLSSRLSGKEVAEKMLYAHGIYNVKVISTEGQQTDYYNTDKKTINLSTDVYYGRSVAAAAVAAHECGHALQADRKYNRLQLRTEVVPFVSISSNLLQWVIIFGVLLVGLTGSTILLIFGVSGLVLITIFSLITLPVELDASRRAMDWLRTNNQVTTNDREIHLAKDALWWASMIYVIAAVGAVGNLIYYTRMLFGRD